MIGNLKALLLAAMALALFGVLGVSSAHGAEKERFHCEVKIGSCKYTALPDEVANTKTAHHVLTIDNYVVPFESVSFTCGQMSGEATLGKEAFAVVMKNIKYSECKVNGSEGVTFKMNGCSYGFLAVGPLGATGVPNGEMWIEGCEAGKKIEIVYTTGCVATIGEQGPLKGITFHNHKGIKELITVETNAKGIAASFDGTKAQCLITPTGIIEATYTTGNTLLTGEEDWLGGVMVNAWYE